MTPAEIFRDWRVGMIAGATLLHLTAISAAWVMIPPGTQTRLDKPIEASLAPAPSSEMVDMDSSPRMSEVISTNETGEAALEDTAEVVPPDAVETETAPPVTQQTAKPDAVTAQDVQPVRQQDVTPDTVEPEAVPDKAFAAATPTNSVAAVSPATPMPEAAPQQVAALAPDILTTADSEESVSTPVLPQQVEPVQDAPAAPSVEQPKPHKAEKLKTVDVPKKKKVEPPVKVQAPEKVKSPLNRLAKLDNETKIKRAQRGGEGAISDIGVSMNAQVSGATVKRYNALLNAAIFSSVRARGSIDCKPGSKANISLTVSAQGRIGAVRLAGGTGDAALTAAALAGVRSASPPPPFNGAVTRTIVIICPRV
jgi:protein TonB